MTILHIVSLLCQATSGCYVQNSVGPIIFRYPQALVGPSLRLGLYNHNLQVSENDGSLRLVTSLYSSTIQLIAKSGYVKFN